jgi:hypothetical protein
MNDERATESEQAPAVPMSGRRSEVEDPLGAALRALPPERAGAGFTARVVARLDERGGAGRSTPGRLDSLAGHPPRFRPAVAWAALAAAALAVAFGLALVRGSAAPRGERAAIAESAAPAAPAPAAPAEVSRPMARAPATGGAARMPASTPDSAPSGGAAAPGAPSAPAPAASDPDPPMPAGSPGGSRVAGSPSDPRHRTAAPAPAGAGAVRLAAAGYVAAGSPRRAAAPSDDPQAALARVRAELDALRREHRRFEVALAELPEIGRDGQPVVFLGGDEGLGLVLDLGREATAGEVAEAGERRPSL